MIFPQYITDLIQIVFRADGDDFLFRNAGDILFDQIQKRDIKSYFFNGIGIDKDRLL